MTRLNDTTTIATLQGIIAGLQKNAPNSSFVLGGATFTTTTLVTICQQILAAMAAVPPAKAAYADAVASSHAIREQHGDLLRDLKLTLQVQAGSAASTLSPYGLTPRKPTGMTSPEVKVAAANKARATRTARHTMGSKQKLQITGTTPAPAAASSPPEASPAAVTTTAATVGGNGTSNH